MIRMIQRVEYKIQTKYKGYRLLGKDSRQAHHSELGEDHQCDMVDSDMEEI